MPIDGTILDKKPRSIRDHHDTLPHMKRLRERSNCRHWDILGHATRAATWRADRFSPDLIQRLKRSSPNLPDLSYNSNKPGCCISLCWWTPVLLIKDSSLDTSMDIGITEIVFFFGRRLNYIDLKTVQGFKITIIVFKDLCRQIGSQWIQNYWNANPIRPPLFWIMLCVLLTWRKFGKEGNKERKEWLSWNL